MKTMIWRMMTCVIKAKKKTGKSGTFNVKKEKEKEKSTRLRNKIKYKDNQMMTKQYTQTKIIVQAIPPRLKSLRFPVDDNMSSLIIVVFSHSASVSSV